MEHLGSLSRLAAFALLVTVVGCGSDRAPRRTDGGPPPTDGGTADAVTPDAPGSDGGPGEDAGVPGGTFAFFTRFPNGHRGDGSYDRRFPIVAVPDGGWVVAFSFRDTLAVAGETFTARGPENTVLVKLDAAGATVWAHPIDGSNEDDVEGLTVDGAGNLYVSGTFRGSSVDFGDGVTVSATDTATQWGFVAKLDSSGVTQWAQTYYTVQGIGSTLVAARGDTVAVAGFYAAGEPFVYQTAAGRTEAARFLSLAHKAFALSLEPADGTARWLARFGTTADADAHGTAVAVDALGGVALTVTFRRGALQTDALVDVVAPTGTDENAAVIALDSGGAVSWARTFGSAGAGRVTAVDVSTGAGHVVALGSFTDAVDFGAGIETAADSDVWLTSLSIADGSTQWVKTLGGPATDSPRGLAVAADGAMAVGVQLSGAAAAAMVDGVALPTTAGTYVLALDDAAVARWAWHLEGEPLMVNGGRLAIGASGTIALLGTFAGTVEFGTGPITAAATYDAFVLGLGR